MNRYGDKMHRALLWMSVVAVVSIGTVAIADTVELVGGQRVEGNLKTVTEKIVSISVGGQTVTFDRAKVVGISSEKGSGAKPSSSGSSRRVEALQALNALKSAVDGGAINFRDYSLRTTDAKITVDRYLADGQSEKEPARPAINAAMGYYLLTEKAWAQHIQANANGGELARDPLLPSCAEAMEAISNSPAMRMTSGGLDQDTLKGIALSISYSSFLPCAARKLAEAQSASGAK
jgi:hypothetical protein